MKYDIIAFPFNAATCALIKAKTSVTKVPINPLRPPAYKKINKFIKKFFF